MRERLLILASVLNVGFCTGAFMLLRTIATIEDQSIHTPTHISITPYVILIFLILLSGLNIILIFKQKRSWLMCGINGIVALSFAIWTLLVVPLDDVFSLFLLFLVILQFGLNSYLSFPSEDITR